MNGWIYIFLLSHKVTQASACRKQEYIYFQYNGNRNSLAGGVCQGVTRINNNDGDDDNENNNNKEEEAVRQIATQKPAGASLDLQ